MDLDINIHFVDIIRFTVWEFCHQLSCGTIFMDDEKKVIVVMPAYNAEKTLRRTYAEVPLKIVDQVILVEAVTPG